MNENTPRQIWLVLGSEGDYSDHHTWTIAAYNSKEDASRHVELAQEWADKNGRRTYDEYHVKRNVWYEENKGKLYNEWTTAPRQERNPYNNTEFGTYFTDFYIEPVTLVSEVNNYQTDIAFVDNFLKENGVK